MQRQQGAKLGIDAIYIIIGKLKYGKLKESA